MTGDDHLGNALAIVDDEVLLRQVDEHHAYLTTVVGIDGSWGVQHRQTMLQSQSTAWAHLCLIALWQGDVQTCRNQSALHGVQGDGLTEIGSQVHAGTLRRSVCGQLLMSAVYNFNLDHFEMLLL